MPIALVQYDSERVPEGEVRWIASLLPEFVAGHLSVPETEGALLPADIEVWVNPTGALDVNKKDLVVVIWAGLYPGREINLDARRQKIAENIRAMFSKKWTGYVWILLQPQSFEQW